VWHQKRLVQGERRTALYDKIFLVDLGSKQFVLLGERCTAPLGKPLVRTQHLIEPTTLKEKAWNGQFYALPQRWGPKAIWSPPNLGFGLGAIFTATDGAINERRAALGSTTLQDVLLPRRGIRLSGRWVPIAIAAKLSPLEQFGQELE
jgi:hypothetical protein